jgi:hypothetical protein
MSFLVCRSIFENNPFFTAEQTTNKVHHKRFRDESPAGGSSNGSNASKEERTLAANRILEILEKRRGGLIRDMQGLSLGLIRLAYTAVSTGKTVPKGRIAISETHLLMRTKNLQTVPMPTLNIEVITVAFSSISVSSPPACLCPSTSFALSLSTCLTIL